MLPAVILDDVSKKFRTYSRRYDSLKEVLLRRRRGAFDEFWALRNVSFAVQPGSTVGIIGANGSGKSTVLKLLAGILYPNKGHLNVNGRISALLELGTGFHPDYTGRENIFLNGALLGLRRDVIRERLDEIIDFADLARFIDNPVKTYSTGMYMRLGFAIAVNVDPDVLLIDEVLAVGDVAFQKKCRRSASTRSPTSRSVARRSSWCRTRPGSSSRSAAVRSGSSGSSTRCPTPPATSP